MSNPIITRRAGGEYSTVVLPDGWIETCWFPDDPAEPSRVIGRTAPQSVRDIAAAHIVEHEATR